MGSKFLVNWTAAHIRDAPRWISCSTRVITGGLLLTAAVVFAQTASQWIDFHFFDLRLRVLDSDHHASVFGALSILTQAIAAAAIGVRAVSARRLSWLLVAAVVGVLTVPRALVTYEPAFQRHEVTILALPLSIVLAALCTLTFRDARPARSIVWTSLILLACSFGLHAVGLQAEAVSRTYLADHSWTYQLTGMLKHGAELAGWMLLATGVIAGALGPTEDARNGSQRHAHREPLPDPLA